MRYKNFGRMCHVIFGLVVLPMPAFVQAAEWKLLGTEPGRRIELDLQSMGRDGTKVTVTSKVSLDAPLVDLRSSTQYQVIETVTRYDCATKTGYLLKRILKTAKDKVVREEGEPKNKQEHPVRTGTVDEKLVQEICKTDAKKAVAKKEGEKSKGGTGAEVAKSPASSLNKAKANAAANAIDQANRMTLSSGSKSGKQRKAAPAKPEAKAPVTPEAPPTPPPPPVAAPVAAPVPPVVVQPLPPKKERLEWSYQGEAGPEHWADIDPENKLCRDGKRQSPINIEGAGRVDQEPVQFNYPARAFQVMDDGHTIQAMVSGNSISLSGKTYHLKQLHFHRPSEERVGGKTFPMDVHLVHKASDDSLVVVVVLLQDGNDNPGIEKIWGAIPVIRNQPVNGAGLLDLNLLLPEDRPYYAYGGSLTTPPCTEGVLRIVMKEPVSVSSEQIAVYERIYPNSNRPVQPLSGRTIKESK